VIVRLMNDGQYEIDEALSNELNELDAKAEEALNSGDEEGYRGLIDEIASTVHERGRRLGDDELRPSDGFVPPNDLSLDEAKKFFADDGLIPDLPVR
jgi:hypothetical protein